MAHPASARKTNVKQNPQDTLTLRPDFGNLHILGEPVQYGDSNGTNDNFLGYSRLTTSPNLPAWVVGNSAPLGGCPSAGNTNVGSLYSVTTGGSSSPPTLLECETSGWQTVK
jgi:hypothetical protein